MIKFLRQERKGGIYYMPLLAFQFIAIFENYTHPSKLIVD